jgi:hypothetical protein
VNEMPKDLKFIAPKDGFGTTCFELVEGSSPVQD